MLRVKLKVCGLRDPENIKQVIELGIDYLGLIFFNKSPRYVQDELAPQIKELSSHTKFVGVFVNQEVEQVLSKIELFGLGAVQLHGDEGPQFLEELRNSTSVDLIKAFRIGDKVSFSDCAKFESAADYFLFDKDSKAYGGSGESFDWSQLDRYVLNKPYFLSGGIAPSHARELRSLLVQYPALYALDLNSRFEIKPGLKDVVALRKFKEELLK